MNYKKNKPDQEIISQLKSQQTKETNNTGKNIETKFTIFKTDVLKHGRVITGREYLPDNIKTPFFQYCYYEYLLNDKLTIESLIEKTPNGIKELPSSYAKYRKSCNFL